jgi:phosphoribosylglycinamide formyltransferase 1
VNEKIFAFFAVSFPARMYSEKFRIAIFASGNGSNAEVIVHYFKNHPAIQVELLVSNNPAAFAIQRAKRLGIDAKIFSRTEFIHPGTVLEWLKEYHISHIVLAGFLWLIPDYLIRAFPDRIINIHPALLPKFGGKGMYGLKVHEAVKTSGEIESGITIHLVNERYDEGRILFQGKCKIEEDYTPAQIATCVQKLEYEHYPLVIENWILSNARQPLS